MEIILFILKLVVLVSLYLFLLELFWTTWREFRSVSNLERLNEALITTSSKLVVLKAGETDMRTGDVLYLAPYTSIGRSLSSTIVLLDSSISSIHAVVTFQDECWWIEDTSSTNGTIVNGVLVVGKSPIYEHDIVELGNVVLQLHIV